MPEFLQRYPDIQLNVGFSDSISNWIEGNLDLVIRLNDPKDSSLISLKRSDMCFCLCASPEYLKKYGTPKKPEDLNQHNCLIYSDDKAEAEWKFSINKNDKLVIVTGNFSTTNDCE